MRGQKVRKASMCTKGMSEQTEALMLLALVLAVCAVEIINKRTIMF